MPVPIQIVLSNTSFKVAAKILLLFFLSSTTEIKLSKLDQHYVNIISTNYNHYLVYLVYVYTLIFLRPIRCLRCKHFYKTLIWSEFV